MHTSFCTSHLFSTNVRQRERQIHARLQNYIEMYNECPKCHQTSRQIRAEKNGCLQSALQMLALRAQIHLIPKPRGYNLHLRRIARHLGLPHRTASLWVKAYAQSLPLPLGPARSRCPRWTNGSPSSGRKNTLYIIAKVDRAAWCFIDCRVVWARDHENL